MSQYQRTYDSFQRDVRDRYVPTSRINVAASAYLPSGDVDSTGKIKPDKVRRHRTQAKRLEEMRLEEEDRKLKESLAREMKKTGVRVTWLTAAVICGVLLFACLFTIGYQHSVISNVTMLKNQLEEQQKACNKENEELLLEVEKACDISKIGYAACNLGLIRAETVEAVYLTAVDTRPLASAQNVYQTQESIEMSAQTTQVPVLASAGN